MKKKPESKENNVPNKKGLRKNYVDPEAFEKNQAQLYSRFNAILSAVPEILTEVDNNKVYTWVNNAGMEFFGIDVIGKRADHYFIDEQNTYKIVEPIFKGSDELICLESWQRRKDGEKRLLSWRCKVLKDENGSVTGALSSARDITEQKQIETKNQIHLEEQLLISEVFSKLVNIVKLKDIYSYIGDVIYKLLPASYIFLSEYDAERKSVKIRHTFGFGRLIETIKNKTGIDPFGMEFLISEMPKDDLMNFKSRKLIEMPEGLYALSNGKVNKNICRSIEKMLGVKSIFTIGFSWEDKLYGGVTLLLRKQEQLVKKELIEIIVNQTAIALQIKFAEEKLAEKEKLYRTLVETSPEGILMIGMDGKLLSANRKAHVLFGYSDEVDLKTNEINIFDFILLIDRKTVKENIKKRIKGELSKNQEYLVRKIDGSLFSVEINTSIVNNTKGHPDHMISVIRDITERKQMEKILQKSEMQYRTISRLSSDFSYSCVHNGKAYEVDWITDAFYTITGYSAEEVKQNKCWLFASHPDDKEEALNQIGRLKPGDFLESEFRIVTKTSNIHYLKNRMECIEDAEAKGRNRVYGAVKDITTDKLAEFKIKVIASQWQETFNAVNDVIWIISNEGKILRSNKACENILGLSETEIVGRYCWEVMHHTKEPIKECPFSCLKNSLKREVFMLQENDRWMEVVVDPIVDSNGLLNGIVHIISDRTTQMQAFEAVRNSEKRYRSLLESLFDMVYITDYNFLMVYANPALESQTGYSVDNFNENEGKLSFVFEDDLKKVNCFIRDFIKSKSVYSHILESRFVNRNGKIRWHSTIISKVDFAGAAALQFICRDVTDQRKSEAALIESEERYRMLHQSMTDCFVQTNMEGQIVFFNNSYKEMLGYSDDELFKLKYYEITPNYWHKMEDDIVRTQILPRGYSDVYEKEYIKKDGSVFPVELRTFLLKDAEDKPIGMWGIVRDISERKHAEENIRLINENLEQRVKTRTAQLEASYNEMEAFTFSVSHDLRAPIRAIDGFSKMLLQEFSDLDPEAIRLLNIICQSSGNMGRLIDDLLVFSRVGRANISPLPLKMKNIVNTVISQLRKENNNLKADIFVKELSEVPGDKTLITQVWTNLIGNAIKFSSRTEKPTIEIGSYSGDNEIIYFVKDNGVGFDTKYIDKLFGVFSRLHSSDEFEGTGIGLAIVRKAIVRHGGRVWAESEEGKGATFFFSLPVN